MESTKCGCSKYHSGKKGPSDSDSDSEIVQDCIADTEIAQKIKLITSESENAWRNISEKQFIISKLRGEQITVSDRFTRYYEIAAKLVQSISDDNSNMQQAFADVNQKVSLESRVLNEFETKLKMTEKVVEDLIHEMRAHFIQMKKWIEEIQRAKSHNDISSQCPSLNWIHLVGDPEVEKLATEWEALHLDEKITQYLIQVKTQASQCKIDI